MRPIYLPFQSTTSFLKSKFLPITFLLISQTGITQELTAMGNGITSSSITDMRVRDNASKETPDRMSRAILETPVAATSSEKNTKKSSPAFLPDNMSKANAMIDSYFQGIYDADSNYTVKKSCKATILLSTIIGGPVIGIIPTIACSVAAPKNLEIPKSTLVTNDSYMRGYKGETKYIKRHNTWPCYVLASIVWLAAANFILR